MSHEIPTFKIQQPTNEKGKKKRKTRGLQRTSIVGRYYEGALRGLLESCTCSDNTTLLEHSGEACEAVKVCLGAWVLVGVHNLFASPGLDDIRGNLGVVLASFFGCPN